MPTYEDRVSEFAGGKKLLRLSRFIRDRADASCDVCASTRPRILYGLQDQDRGRYYFVGETCLKGLVKRGAILKRFGRGSAREAYELEIQRRSSESKDAPSPGSGGADSPSGAVEARASRTTEESELGRTISDAFPVVFAVEGPEIYRVIVCLLSAHGPVLSWGYAEETRYHEVWCRRGERGIVLDKVRKERTDALDRSVTKAWEDAFLKLEALRPPPGNGTAGVSQRAVLRNGMDAIQGLAGVAPVVNGLYSKVRDEGRAAQIHSEDRP